MPLQELLYKERYETVLNEAMQYSMEFDMPDEEINAFISYIGKPTNATDSIFLKTVSQKILPLIPMNIVPQAYSQKRTTYKEWIRKL